MRPNTIFLVFFYVPIRFFLEKERKKLVILLVAYRSPVITKTHRLNSKTRQGCLLPCPERTGTAALYHGSCKKPLGTKYRTRKTASRSTLGNSRQLVEKGTGRD